MEGISINRGIHSLGPNTRIKLQRNFTKAVRSNIRPGIISSAESEEAVTSMRKAILASLYHCTMLEDDEVRHQYCPMDSWCLFKRGLDMGDPKAHYLRPALLDKLLPVYEYYTQTPMLQRMVAGDNQ